MVKSKCSKAFAKGGGADAVDSTKDSATPQTPQVKNKSNFGTFEETLQKFIAHSKTTSSKSYGTSAYNKFRVNSHDHTLPAETTLRNQYKEYVKQNNLNPEIPLSEFLKKIVETGGVKSDSVALQEDPKDVKSETSEQTESTSDRPVLSSRRRARAAASAQKENSWFRRLMGTRTPRASDRMSVVAIPGNDPAVVEAREQTQALTKAEVQAIPLRRIKNIQEYLLPKQVAWLNKRQLEQADLSLFGKKQIQALIEEQLSLDSVLKGMTAKEAQDLTIKQVRSIPINKLHLIQSKLLSRQIARLNDEILANLSTELLTKEQIVELPIEILQKIGVHRLSVEQLKYVAAEKVQGLTKDDLDQLSVEQMQSIQKHLSVEQIVELKEEHLDKLVMSSLTPDQVRILSEKSLLRFLPHLLSATQLQGVNSDYVAHITGKELNKMNTMQLKAIQDRLSSSQLNQLKKKLFQTLSFESLNLEQVEGLSSKYFLLAQSKINSKLIPSIERLVSDFKMEWMTTQQIQAMTVEQLHVVLNQMSSRQIQVLTNEQVDGLLEDSVGLSSRNLRRLRKNLSVHQTSGLSQEKKDKLNFKKGVLTNTTRLRQLQVGDPLTAKEVRRLIRSTPEMAYVLSADHLNNLSKWRLRNIQRYLLPEQIASLSRDKVVLLNMELLSTVQVQAFTPRQLNFLETEQLRDIQGLLLPSQIADLSTSTLTKLSLKKLRKQQLEALTTDQLTGLGYERVYLIWDKLLPEQQQISGWQPALRRQR